MTMTFRECAIRAMRGVTQNADHVLFTDMVDSSDDRRIGDVAWRTLKSRYEEKVSAAGLTGYDGTLVDTSGDGIVGTLWQCRCGH